MLPQESHQPQLLMVSVHIFTGISVIIHLVDASFAFCGKHVFLRRVSSSLLIIENQNHPFFDDGIVSSNSDAFMHTSRMTTASGKPLYIYALGGAARSVQPSSLPLKYRDVFASDTMFGSPFYFYYSPHRYPAFLSGVVSSFTDNSSFEIDRGDVFIASGGSDRSIGEIDQSLDDALKFSGGTFLDAFVLEYVCPEELVRINPRDNSSSLQCKVTQSKLGSELESAIQHLRSLVEEGTIRYILASTFSFHRCSLGELKS
jgi:hypothetical protein